MFGREAGIRTQMLRLSVVDTNPYMTSLYGGQNKSRTYSFGFSDQRAHRLRYLSMFGGQGVIRTHEAEASNLQSDGFSHLPTCP